MYELVKFFVEIRNFYHLFLQNHWFLMQVYHIMKRFAIQTFIKLCIYTIFNTYTHYIFLC